MEFFTSAISVMQTLVTLIGGGLGLWGIVNLLEGYGGDNSSAKSQGIKQLMAGVGLAVLANLLIPQLSGMFASEASASVDYGYMYLYAADKAKQFMFMLNVG